MTYDLSFAQRVEIQKLLYRHGFDPGGTDGRFGARTYEAILGFQNKSRPDARRHSDGGAA